MAVPLPPKFKVPQIDMYDGSRDHMDHLDNFKAHMTLHDFPGEITYRAFPLNLKRIARDWFGTLQPGSINSFEELAKQFLTQFMVSRQCCGSTAYLLTIKQREGESFKAYLIQFKKERLSTEDQDEKITLDALLGGIWPQSSFITELARKTPSTLREFMNKDDDYVNAEDTLQALLEPRKQEVKSKSKNSNRDKKESYFKSSGRRA
ncbi:uncharacterized protein LOC122293724 [Carya illinoinensis]|uniref:uncharacterized protein LOC122293724 n=1 Tax=Carya illinoinensis TaxID=32201 RepID=UPI001C721E60|nr:uncharacterized protein LOC122293724 [Carya illinoinensis]